MTADRAARVSVCIPTVNRAQLLPQAIDSVAAQTYSDFEIVIADNSGDPAYHARVDEIIARYPGLTFVLKRHPTALDSVENFNSLIDAARGELWVCLPDDDRLCPTFLARSVEALDRHPECGFTFGDHWLMNEDGVIDREGSVRNSAYFGRNLLNEGVYRHPSLFRLALNQSLCLQTMMLRREVIRSLRFLPGVFMSDLSLTLRMGVSRDPIDAYYIADRIFEYRNHAGQLTTAMKRKGLLQGFIAALESPERVPPDCLGEYRTKLARQYLSLGIAEAEDGDRKAARSHARKAFSLAPSVRTAVGGALVAGLPFLVSSVRRVTETIRMRAARR